MTETAQEQLRAMPMCRGVLRVSCQSILSLGTTYAARGDAPRARRHYLRGRAEARRHELREDEVIADHELFLLAVETGDHLQAARLAPSAVQGYAALNHPNLPRLAHDVGRFWLLLGDFCNAIPVIDAVLPHIKRPSEQMIVWGNLARAAGGVGNSELFERAWREVESLAAESGTGEHAARCMLGISLGAAALERWTTAKEMGGRALDLAVKRGEHRVVFEAEAHLNYISTRSGRGAAASHPRPPCAKRSRLAARVVATLSEHSSAAT
ncbi:MAG: hypothetical protein LC667_01340 [Thioalkalivibrio sp.]|nr:hypothetical protein [Thioalkalivibrio sp.]